ncbi:DUF4403 family protein [Aquirufa sp. HETE-83D]|uniref:DUF4403 family protein n=1 Tax=Aquirufa esocilacus TaxID=3096513 RepID=A0ABW6DGJ4_9BACT
MRIYLLFLLGFISSCAKTIVPAKIAEKSVYVDHFPTIKSGLTTLDFSISYDSLFALSQLRAGSMLYQNSSGASSIDFPIDVRLLGPIQLQAIQKDHISLSLPVRMVAKPELAGISAGTVSGDLAMKVQLKWNLASINSLQVKEVAYDYQWIQKPSVKVMGFPVNVSGVVDQLMNQKKAMILAQMQEQLNNSIKSTVMKPFALQTFIPESSTGYQIVPAVSSALDLRDISFDQTSVKGQLRFSGGLKVVTGLNKAIPTFIPIKDLPGVVKPILPFQFQLTGSELMDLLKSTNASLKGAGSFTFLKEGFGFQLAEFKGKSSLLTLGFDLVIYPDNSIGIQVRETQLQGLSFPASLFKGRIQKKLQSQAAAFRFQSKQILNRLPSSITLAKNGRVRFQKIYFDSSSVLFEGAFEGNWSLAK